jgi:2-haloacid dehalogenase
VDWFGSIQAELEPRLGAQRAGEFALAWRARYQPAMERVRSGQWPWMPLDELHRRNLDEILPQFGLTGLTQAELTDLNFVWHRLRPWPDTAAALERLRSRFLLTTLSNGNLGLLARLMKNAGLRFDLILSAESFQAYKPQPAAYLGVGSVFSVPNEAVMLVAAHKSDLAAARSCGLRTAFVERPNEYGPDGLKQGLVDFSSDHDFDVHGPDLHALADQLGCDR